MRAHWDEVYASKAPDEVSWFQPQPSVSIRLLEQAASPGAGVVDVGAGASLLADALLERGWSDLTLLDVSAHALSVTRARLGDAVSYVVADLLTWDPPRTYDAWHDRAVFHFLVDEPDRLAYAGLAARAVAPGGAVVLGSFASDGPEQCSGLPTVRLPVPELAALFAPAFALEHAEREEHVTPAGAVQPFSWVVLRRAQRPPDTSAR
jgi:SAM-dependent methyltransferase